MKRLIFNLALVGLLLASCSKSVATDPNPVYHIKVIAYSATPAQVNILEQQSRNFKGQFVQEFDAKSSDINVILHSAEASGKSITIYVNGNEVAHRGGNCVEKDYQLQYSL